jgi:hypothetical protein
VVGIRGYRHDRQVQLRRDNPVVEGGRFHQHLARSADLDTLGIKVLLFAGELDAIFERLAEVFFALKAQDVEEQCLVVADDQTVRAVFEALVDR